ncbi:MAG: serine/threonine protein kinase, partial [Coriobacteriia bacterium]|nr:serine/threonine protein kinase [Coriobacteriia bacterium]
DVYKRQPLDLDEAAAVVDAVADALTYAHANGVLHLDLKPQNVLVDRYGRVKVADFGVAALTDAAGTGTGRGGTPGYMPPEQAGRGALTQAADQWAFAALVYEMLTGEVPFGADRPPHALAGAGRGRFVPPSVAARGLTPGIDRTLERALAADPEQRFPDVAAFADTLLDHLGDPAAGRESLAEIVGDLLAEEEPSVATPGLWDRLLPHASWLSRGIVAAASAWLGWAGALPVVGMTGAAAAGGLCGIAGAVAPPLGLALGLLAAAIGAGAAAGALGVGVLGLAGATWWAVVARRFPEAGCSPAVAAAASSVRLSAAVPLSLGFFLEPLPATVGGAAAGAVTAALSALAGGSPSAVSLPAWFVQDPWRVWGQTHLGAADVRLIGAVTASWGVAALAASLGAGRGTRFGAALGSAVGLIAMAAALGAAAPAGLAAAALDICLGAAVSAALIAAGPPPRG